MKKSIAICIFALSLFMALGVQAQNIQLHYDFGRSLYGDETAGRPHITTTVEKFMPDSYGSTFFFVDMDYNSNGVKSAYWEVSRELKFWEGPFSAHVEYNGGLNNSFSFNNAYLLGATYTYNTADFSKGFTLTAMYKYIQKNPSPQSFQITGTWHMNFCKDKFTFSGFADFWREQRAWQGTNTIFLAEPQFWVNLNKVKGFSSKLPLSIGSELELSNNFVAKGFFAIPTIALKWTLN